MKFHGPSVVRFVIRDFPVGSVVVPPPVHLHGHPCDVASSWGEEEADWTRNLSKSHLGGGGGGGGNFLQWGLQTK